MSERIDFVPENIILSKRLGPRAIVKKWMEDYGEIKVFGTKRKNVDMGEIMGLSDAEIKSGSVKGIKPTLIIIDDPLEDEEDE